MGREIIKRAVKAVIRSTFSESNHNSLLSTFSLNKARSRAQTRPSKRQDEARYFNFLNKKNIDYNKPVHVTAEVCELEAKFKGDALLHN